MAIAICPRCNERVVVDDHARDHEHYCIGGSAVSTESVPDMTKANWNMQGYGSKSLKKNVDDLNVHGDRLGTHLVRHHDEYFEVS